MTKLWAMDYGINWDWFAHIELHDDGTATVLCEGRLHKYEDRQGAVDISKYWEASAPNSYRIEEPKPDYDVWPRPPRQAIDGPIGRWDFPHLIRL